MEPGTSWILQFLQNICLFAAIVLCHREIIRAVRNERQRTLLLGLLFGAAAITGAALPVVLPSGGRFDTEVLTLGLSALFGGPFTALIATLVDDAFQLALHGRVSLLHLLEPSAAGAVSLCFLLYERRRTTSLNVAGLACLGILLATVSILKLALVDGKTLIDLARPSVLYAVIGSLLGTTILGWLLQREVHNLRRERAHAQESKMLGAVLESMSDGLLAVDTSGKFLVFNRPAQDMLGDWRGDKFESWLMNYRRFRLDGVTPIAAEELALPRALRGLETNDLNVVVRSPSRPDGFVISVNGRPLRDDQGNVVAGITVVRDVSELISAQKRLAISEAALKLSEERYALAFKGAYDGLWDWDLRTDNLFWSARCLEIIGYPEDSVAGQMETSDWWEKQIHPEDAPATLRALQDCLTGTARSFAVEYRLRRLDGSYCWVADRGAVIRDENGRPYRAAGSLTDISARKLAEQHRRVLEDQLQQTQKIEALGTLAGGIAHDINNTLIPIIGTVDMLLQDTDKDSDLGESLQDVMSAAVKVKELVRQILSFSRHEGSERCTVNMSKEIAGTLRMLRAMVPATISLDLYARADNLTCKVNQTQAHQVIMNLVSNAVGAIGPNRGAIRVTLDQVDLKDDAIAGQPVVPGSYCRISVIDTGPGVPAEVKSRLFDPFFTTKPVGEGTGLGLSVVQGIVRDHGGFILVDNEPGEGARFDVHFPLVQQTAPISAAAE